MQHDAYLKSLKTAQARVHELEEEVQALRVALPRAEVVRELSSATVEDLEGLVVALRAVADQKLLDVPPAWASRYEAFAAQPNSGLGRILPRGRYEALVSPQGGGAYYSFATRSNSYSKEPDLELQQGRYSSGFYGGTGGWILDLGEMEVDDVGDDPSRPPAGFAGEALDAWRFLWTDRPAAPPSADRRDAFLEEMRGKAPASLRNANAVPGHTYLLRSILSEEHDHLVVFRDLEDDGHGRTLAWRVLRSWPVPRRR